MNEINEGPIVEFLNRWSDLYNPLYCFPGSDKIKEASETIDKCRKKLEQKDFKAAQLYYNLSEYRSAAIAYTNLLNDYPESSSGENYKLMVVKSLYKFAKMSILSKQEERYEKVISEYEDFMDRYPESKLLKTAESYRIQSQNQIKIIINFNRSHNSKN